MKLKKLIADLPLKVASGSKEIEIMGLSLHSKLVAPGDLFLAKQPEYILEALSAGAVAIVTDFYDPSLAKEVTQLITENVAAVLPALAARFFSYPSKNLYAVGVTGTNGKTTTSYLIKHLLDQLGVPSGLMGTVEYIVGEHHFPSELTTPDAITSQKLLAEMVKLGCKAVVMEVSSHGLVQKRVEAIDFAAAIFTNLTQDHLDYHGTMEEYAQAKELLFTSLKEGAVAIVNEESPYASKMVKNCVASLFSYGFSRDADIFAYNITLSPFDTRFWVKYRGENLEAHMTMVGKHNILNALAAISLCLMKGFSLKEILPHLATFGQVPGRLERIENDLGLHLYVDYAHTPDALENVLIALRPFCERRLLVVFGAGGGRDRGKRPQMGEVVSKLADFAFITSDNPRNEDPEEICQQIVSGFRTSHYVVELDRRKAIEKAIKEATPKDLVLIAGKGHEGYQIFSHKTLPFDDRKVAKEILQEVEKI